MRALTLWPEWAHAIRFLGKLVENRGWRPTLPLRLAIHAGAHIGGRKGKVALREGLEAVELTAYQPDAPLVHLCHDARGRLLPQLRRDGEAPRPVLTSAVVATATVKRVLEPVDGLTGRDPWHVPDQYGWQLDDLVVLRHPLRDIKGAQNLWAFTKGSHPRWSPKKLADELRVREALSRGFEVLNTSGVRLVELDATRTLIDANAQRMALRGRGVSAQVRVAGDRRALEPDEYLYLLDRERQLDSEERRLGVAA